MGQMKQPFCSNMMMFKSTISSILFILCMQSKGQNNLQMTFTIGHGNSSWQDDNHFKIAETGATGDTLNVYDVNTHAACPTLMATLNVGYTFNKLNVGISITTQHFFLNEFITDAIYFEGSGTYAPITFSAFNDPQPTHFKFYPFLEFVYLRGYNAELFISASGGTYLTSNMSEDSLEGFHWFVNTSFGLNYTLNKNVIFTIAPTFDYSRFSLDLIDDPDRKDPFFNIWSFYTSFGVKYNFFRD